MIVLAAACLGYSFVEPFWLKVKHYDYVSAQVPPEFDGTTVVLLTDIHRSWYFSQDRVRRLVDKVNGLQPDMVALAGDYVYADLGYEASCFAELAKLKAPLGRFAVLGNHDYGDDEGPDQAITAIDNAGIELLDNRGIWVERDGARIRIGGVSDYHEAESDVGPTLEGTAPEDLVMLLSHNPDYAEDLDGGIVDLMLSGHTHGGQITFFGLWAPHLPSDYGQKYRSGVVHDGDTTVVVSNGVGTILPPLRFFARPQIVVITLRHGSSTP